MNPVVAINAFPSDTEEEVKYIQGKCKSLGVNAVVAKGWADGGDGMKDLAQAVVDVIDGGANHFIPLYNWKSPVKEKIETIATKIYGAKEVVFSKKALLDLRRIDKLGLNELPICMAKTQKSFSDNAKLLGRPTDFEVEVREFEYAVGAGFIIPILGKMMRMPGLPATPASENMSIDDNGVISGLS